MQLTKQQKDIHDLLMDWVSDNLGTCAYRALSGYAGTGKTTLLGELALSIQKKFPKVSLSFITYTGKASTVLASKLDNSKINWDRAYCGTIHSVLYDYLGEKHGQMMWKTKDHRMVLGDLIIVDEASMITPKILKDLLRLNRPILFVGDPGQLPPIDSECFQPLLDTPFILTEIHRQAWDNPIIQLATRIRQGETIDYGVYGNKAAKLRQRSRETQKMLGGFYSSMLKDPEKIILCAKNYTRTSTNSVIRYKAGLGKHPEKGERIICLKNNKEMGLMNGFIVPLESCFVKKDRLYHLELGSYGRAYCHAKSFNSADQKALKTALSQDRELIKNYTDPDSIMFFDYAYAITVHKSQGSEWEKVVLFDERLPFYSEEEYRKWLYTGVTRAKEKLLIVG